MPISIADLASMMDAEGYPYDVRDDGETTVIGCDVATESYRDANGHSGVGLVIDVLEDNAYVTIVAPRAYYLADCPHKAAALEAFMGIQWRWKMVVCEYDSDDGEVRLAVSLPVEDGDLTQRQFLRLLWSIPQFLDRWHSCIVRTMETGIIDFDSDSNGPVSATEAPLLADSVDYDASSRTVRIFISSTFRDFTQERDLLVRKVFPELRRRCRERQVELIDVDLRWGITEEEAQQGRVLPICLAEIDRARPFFMGLMGDRYGWVPAAEQFDQSLLIEQPWLDEHRGGKSVTELEILHGVLNNPEMAGRAFFYFRDSAWSQKQGDGYASEGVSEKQKLLHLKDRIRSSGFPVVESYPDPETLAERVREDLWSLIDAAYPESEMPDALALERQRHSAYGASRRRLYLGGERYFEALDDELANDAPRPALVTGQSGGGKSALLSNWLARWQPAHPEAAVIVHHLGCGADAADPVRLTVRLMQEISLLTGEKFEPKSDPDEQLDDLPQWLAIASVWAKRTDRTVLIILDGLDKLSDRRHLRWFPMALPPRVSLVASCLVGEVLDAARPRLEWQELIVEPFSATEQSRFIAEYLGRYRKQLTPTQAQSLQSHPLSGNPLYLVTVLEELRVFGVHEELDQRLVTLLSPPPSKQPGEEPTVDDAFEHVLARIEGDLGREPVQRVMEALWASRAGLYTDELLEIANVPPATWAGIENALDESLYETRGRVAFGHDYLRKAVEDRYAIAGEETLGLHRRLAEYFDLFEPDLRIAEELPWQWREAKLPEQLQECLTSVKMFAVLYCRNEYELLGYWIWLGCDMSAAYERAFRVRSSDQDTTTEITCLVNFLRTGGYYSDFGVSLCRKVLHTEEKRLGPDHTDTLASVNRLADLLSDQGDYAAAEPLYRRALAGQEKTLGPDHTYTLASVNNLADLLSDQGDYAAAEPLYRRALAGQEKVLGLNHPDTLSIVNNLGTLLRKQSDYAAAEPLYRRALAGLEKALGPDHPNTLFVVNSFANLLGTKGDDWAAEPLYRRALAGWEKTLGPDHPATLASVYNLATLLGTQGDYAAAEPLYRRALAGQEKTLGPDHLDTLSSINNLATVLRDQGDYAGAQPLYRRALAGREKVLGPDHPDTLSSIDDLATLLHLQGDYAAAEPLYRQVLAGREKAVDTNHSATLSSVYKLALLLRDQGDYAAAEPLFRRALAAREKALGPDHSDTLEIVDNLVQCVDAITPIPHAVPVAATPGTVTNSIGIKLVPIPAGEFLMGAPEDCPFGDTENEEFEHHVRITKPFLLGMHQVTQAQYEKVTGDNPSFFKGADLPVEHLSWKQAQRFCELLSALPEERTAARRYRLPTEAEWEYACRAGTRTTFNTGDSLELSQARFATTRRSSPKPTAPVGSYPPNAWGLFDMHGNVWEWTNDWFSAGYFRESPIDDPQGPARGTHHTLRGGSASVEAYECRSAVRGEASAVDGPETNTATPYAFYGDFGVRVVCEATAKSESTRSQTLVQEHKPGMSPVHDALQKNRPQQPPGNSASSSRPSSARDQLGSFSSRTVRIFISSTFRDFAGERDLLVRKVFPELRRRCRERQVELVDVDLRWGITEAEAEQGKVLPICLTEIDRARPFFMGLLGERYGWVPAAGQFDRSLLVEQPWLEEHAGGKSVTELEILHGVLNNPQMAGRAFFYFRDPAWSATQGADYTTGSEAERVKLADLKDRICASGFPVVEDYSSPETLAEQVREDLWSLIDAAYPEADVPDPLALERRRHESYATSRRRLYLGGERYFKALDAELSAESPLPVLVRGRSGGGKSALVANWLARWAQANPDTAVIVHHLGCGADAADPVRMAVRIMQEIAVLVGKEFKPKSDPEEQLDELAKWLATASAWAGRIGRTVLIVLDGLDKLADRRHLRWFPTVLPPGVRLVASCLDGEVLEAARPRLPWQELVVEPFSVAEQTQFIAEYLGRFRKQLTPEQTRLLQAHPLVSNPLFLLTVLEELRVFGVHEKLDERLTTLLSPPPSKQPGEEPTVDDAFEHVLARIEVDHGAEPVQRVMEAIWASRAGLYTDEILAIAEVPPAIWAGISNALDESLYETSGRINFGHDYLRKAAEDRYAIEGDTRLALHRRLAECFTSREADARVADELPWQWRESQSREELRECLTNLEMFSAIYSRDAYELLGYWVWVGDDASAAYEAAYGSHVGDLLRQRTVARSLAWFLKLAGCSSDFLVSLYQAIIQDDEQRQGAEHPDTLRAVNALAWVLAERGDYETSSRLYLRAVEGQMKTLGLHHESTLMCLSDAARLLQIQGDYVAAHAIYRQALEGCSLSFGDGHPLTLIVAGNLAGLLCDQGNYDDAEALLKWVLAEGEQADGVDHPNSLSTINNLALLYKRRGAYAGAEAMYRRARQCSERSMGSIHPITLLINHNLANVFGRQGDVDAARALHELVLSEREKSLGHDHPDTCESIASVANLLRARGEYDRAKALYQRALVGLEKSLGPDHPSTLNCVGNVAGLLSVQGEHAAAETLYRRALAGFEKVLGPDHPNTLQIAGTLAESVDAITPVFDSRAFPDPPGTVINSIGMKLVAIPAGDFMMGSPGDCPFGDPEEEFQHRVRITKPFLLGMHQVTQSQCEKVTGENPSFFKGPGLPVEHLTWNEARRFCELLSDLPEERSAGRRYRLPTEAEWEYACRAGTTTLFNTGDTLEQDQARFAMTNRSAPKQTAPVGSYPPNAWGLFDMHGNVWEWTSDWFSADYYRESPLDDPQGPTTGTHHTLRGGSASVVADECRSAIRGEASAADGPEITTGNRYPLYGDFGVRVVCDILTSVVSTVSTQINFSAISFTFDFKREIIDPLTSLRNQLCEFTTKDTAASILPAVLMPLAKDGVGHPLITLALVSDLLRVLRDAVYADDSLSTAEEGFVGPVAWVLINQMAKHRKDYAAMAAAPQRTLRNALEFYSSDAKAFGYACSTTKWAGVVICRQASPLCKGWSASDDYLAILRKLATAILSVDNRSDDMLQRSAESLLADAVALSHAQ